MKIFPLSLLSVVLGLGWVVQTHAATIVDIELAFILDSSDSISPDTYNAQKQAYYNILTDNFYQDFVQPNIGRELKPGKIGVGKIAVAAFQYGSRTQTSIDWMIVENQADASNFGQKFLEIQKLGGRTSMGAGIQRATNSITTNSYTGTQLVFDISSDGLDNPSPNLLIYPILAAKEAQNKGVDVFNAISTPAKYPGLLQNITFGTNLNNNPKKLFTGDSILDYENVLRDKLRVETGTIDNPPPPPLQVPEPALTIGLIGFAALSLKSKSLKKEKS